MSTTLSADAFASLLSGPLIEVTVGQSSTWQIHRNLLSHHSPNTFDTTLDLTNHSVASFRIFLKYLYQGSIPDIATIPAADKWEYTYACCQLYMLAEHLKIPALQNLAIDQFRKGCHETKLVPGGEEIEEIYKATESGSMLRKLVAKIAARQILDPMGKGVDGYVGCCESKDFCVDVLAAMREGVGGMLLDDPTEGNGCRYHVHEGGGCGRSVRFEDMK